MTRSREPRELTGRCLCGAVSYKALGLLDRCYVCHCTDCQRRSGSAFAINVPVAAQGFEVSGRTIVLSREHIDGRSNAIHFCPSCLTRLYTVNPAWPGSVILRGGSLDEARHLIPSAHIWTRSRQKWVPLPAGVTVLETQPLDGDGWRALME